MPIASPETTELERRVLAHERILQALIAYMARTEPRFVDHLRERFVEPMSMARHEHDHRETDDYAEEFIRAVMLLGEARVPANAFLRSSGYGPGWSCERGYEVLNGACVAIDLPENAYLDRSSNRWSCNRGFQLSDGACVLGR
ncbi:hypothetical protein GCM10007315_23630 [Gemmobacter tilapiae]|uniref:Uncharacterized protein n=2 Tax=Neogemmobacter tilapiae TaxID=875041 RepID=A0A918TSL3_9RHOB|nr:hypothetical protein GCM10007315_23630 [Gemmobacter tilapiae]